MSEFGRSSRATAAEIAAFELGTSVVAQFYAGSELFDKYTIIKYALQAFEAISLTVMEGETLPIIEKRWLSQADYNCRDENHAYVINMFFESMENAVIALPLEFQTEGIEIYETIRAIVLIKTAHGKAFTNKAPGEA